MAIIGDDEVENKAISIRARNGNQKNGILVEIFLDKIKSEIDSRSKALELA
jgi:threonyl-tRNA synthetase